MLCLAALIVLAILGIFSATHRDLAKEAFACVFRRVTLRPCDSDFQTKIKSDIVGWLMQRNQTAARLFNRYSEVFAWLFVTLSLVSLLYAGYAIYNYVVHGTCNPSNPEECVVKTSFWENLLIKLNK